VNPFKALKGVAVAEPEPPAKGKPQPALSAQTPPTDEPDDMALFLRAMTDVQKLDGTRLGDRVRRHAVPEPATTAFDEEDGQLFLSAMKGMQVRFRDEIRDAAKNPQASPSRMRQLRRGTIRIDFELDLHGLTRDEALASLAQFITGAYNRGQQAVLVITGKGNNSPGEPVLQGAVSGWLREQGKSMVVEFAPAPREMGGSGALVVFLRDKEKLSQPPSVNR